jgi:hypothetical protein
VAFRGKLASLVGPRPGEKRGQHVGRMPERWEDAREGKPSAILMMIILILSQLITWRQRQDAELCVVLTHGCRRQNRAGRDSLALMPTRPSRRWQCQ